MADWIQCPSCQLNHSIRPDGLCPRCRAPVVSRGWAAGPTTAATPPDAPAQATPPPPPPFGATAVAAPPPAYAPFGQGVPPLAYGSVGPVFTVGEFLSGTFSTWGRNLGVIAPLVLLLAAPLSLTMYSAYAGMPAQPRDFRDFPWDKLSLAMLVGLVVWPLQLAGVVRAGARRLRGERAELGDALSVGLRRFLPTLGVVLLVGLAYLGTICTIAVPMVLLTGWAATVPAVVEERLGPIESLRRSWALTRGSRWQVFAGFLVLVLVVGACACLFQSVAAVVVLGASGAFQGGPGLQAGSTMGSLQAVNVVTQALENSLLTTATAVAYQQLRAAKEGHAQEHLVRVFE